MVEVLDGPSSARSWQAAVDLVAIGKGEGSTEGERDLVPVTVSIGPQ